MHLIALIQIVLSASLLSPSQVPASGVQPLLSDGSPALEGDQSSNEALASEPQVYPPDHVYQEAPPWKHGATVLLGTGNGHFLSSFHESSTFDIDNGFSAPDDTVIDTGELNYSLTGVSIGMATNSLSVELLLGSVGFDERQGAQTGTDDGLLAGGRAGLNFYQRGHLACGVDIALLVGSASIQGVPSGKPGSLSSDTDLRWLQADLRTAISYAPSSTALFSVAPTVGIGLRLIDGVQKAPLGDLELDAQLFYLMGGLSANWRPSNDFQLGFETQAMIGQLEGISFSLNLSF